MAIKLTKQQQQLIIASVIGGGAFIFCYVKFFWMPLSQKISDVDAKIVSLEREIEVATRQAARLADLDKQLVNLNERKIEAEKRLPKTKSVPAILVTVGGVASKYRIALMSFSPGAMKPQTYVTELQYPIVLRGTFHNIGKFLAGLALEQRLYNVYNVAFSEPAGDAGEMSVTMMLVSYQYKEG